MTPRGFAKLLPVFLGIGACGKATTEPDAGEPFLLSQISANLTICGAGDAGYCWGEVIASEPSAPRPITLPAGVIIARVNAGRGFCVLTTASTGYCLDEAANDWTWAPVVLPDGPGIRAITGAPSHICALSLAGAAFCWGDNELGRLGDGTVDSDRTAPTAVTMPAGVTFAAIEAGEYVSCGLTGGGKAWCWGYNGEGQMGTGTADSYRAVPTEVAMPGLTFITLAVGAAHVCGLTPAGAAYCWGFGYRGRLGNGTVDDKYVPTAVLMPPATTFASLTAGRDHTCALTPEGAAWCWGRNFAGAVGDGSLEHRSLPAAVTMPAGVSFQAISAGFAHTCAVATDGQAWCWGWNSGGRLGDRTTIDHHIPVKVIQRYRP